LRPLVPAGVLLDRLGEPGLVVVDCRFVLGEPGAGERAYRAGHIPGAAFLDVDRDLASAPGERGRHPLPAAGAFAAVARRAGISSDSAVVAYDETGEGGAARLWWLLRHFGHEQAAVLDGGLGAWREAGGLLVGGGERHPEGDFTPRPLEGDTAELEELRELDPGLSLVDARAPERYSGELEPIDPVAGHIPGARNVPFTELAPGGRYLPAAELRTLLGDRPLVVYCGSGVSACTVVLAAELVGVEARLYPGSWSEWSGRGMPVARR
jgi:thiosulfate/3-mercaptopyruvate sulfurtransferase